MESSIYQQQQHSPSSAETAALLSMSTSSSADSPLSPTVPSVNGNGTSSTSSLLTPSGGGGGLRSSGRRSRTDRVQFAPTTMTHGDDTTATSTLTTTAGAPVDEISLNDVFLSTTPGRSPAVGGGLWCDPSTPASVVWEDDDVDGRGHQPLVRNDTSRGSFYNNPYRHDTIDSRVRRANSKSK